MKLYLPSRGNAAALNLLEDAGFDVVQPTIGDADWPYRLLMSCSGLATVDYWWQEPSERYEVFVAAERQIPVRPYLMWANRGC